MKSRLIHQKWLLATSQVTLGFMLFHSIVALHLSCSNFVANSQRINSTSVAMEERDESYSCERLPSLISRFADTFVDFVVGGQFLPDPSLNNNGENEDESGDASQTVKEDSKRWAERITRLPGAERVIAIGDIHGDLLKARQVLISAKVMDGNDRWIGGKTVVVQVGDLLDRGDDELKVLYLFESLKRQAERAGGSVVVLNGNHEIMNMEGNFRYATPAAMEEFKKWAWWYSLGERIKGNYNSNIFEGIPSYLPEGWRARLAALRPGGPVSSRFFSQNPTVAVVGGSVFVHGGLLPTHVEYGLERMNEEVRDWVNGLNGSRSPSFVRGRDAVVWLRKYSEAMSCDCQGLEKALKSIPGAERMIVGHTIQAKGINGACGNKVLRVDVGMSKGCIDGMPEALEIKEDKELRILTTNPLYQSKGGDTFKEKPGLGLLLPEKDKKHDIEVKI